MSLYIGYQASEAVPNSDKNRKLKKQVGFPKKRLVSKLCEVLKTGNLGVYFRLSTNKSSKNLLLSSVIPIKFSAIKRCIIFSIFPFGSVFCT